MRSSKIIRFGPVHLLTGSNNTFAPPTVNATFSDPNGTVNSQSHYIIRHLRVVNVTSSSTTVSCWITGGAGTEFFSNGTPVPANSYIDWYGAVRVERTEFLQTGAGVTNALTLSGEGEIRVT